MHFLRQRDRRSCTKIQEDYRKNKLARGEISTPFNDKWLLLRGEVLVILAETFGSTDGKSFNRYWTGNALDGNEDDIFFEEIEQDESVKHAQTPIKVKTSTMLTVVINANIFEMNTSEAGYNKLNIDEVKSF